MDLTTLNVVRNPGAPQRSATGVVHLRHEGAGQAERLRDHGAPIDALAPAAAGPGAPIEDLMKLLDELDTWLAPYGDRPAAGAFLAWRTPALKESKKVDAAVFDAGRQYLGTAIVSHFARPDWPAIRRLTRLVLLLELLDPGTTTNAVLRSHASDTDLVFDLLRRRTPLFPQGLAVTDIPEPRVQLIRGAKVSDLFVVRSEWSCYQVGEIAAITNVLAHEELARVTTLTDEQEVTTAQTTESFTSEEKVDEDRTQSEVSREVNRAQELQIKADASVKVSGSYGGMVTFGANASVGVSASVSESSRQASRIARDVVSRATSKVENRVREDRVRRTLTRSVDKTRHAIANPDATHIRGVYRWVDRFDRYQVFRYPDRLQLEFEIPEPGQYLRYRLKKPNPPPPGGVSEPPPFKVVASDITRKQFSALALRYRAGSLPPPPDEAISVSAATSLTPTNDEKVDPKAEDWTAPHFEKEVNVTLPEGYAATEISIAATATPKRAAWHVERAVDTAADNADTVLDGENVLDGFHEITFTMVAGGNKSVAQKGGKRHPAFTVQLSDELGGREASGARSATLFGDAYLATGPTTLKFAQPVHDKVSFAVSLIGGASAAVSAEVKCVLRPEALAEWQNTVYDLLLDAWRAWDREWRLQQAQTIGPQLSAIDATSPARNLQLITEELKRQVIAWLLDDDNFAGIDAMVAAANGWRRYSIDQARATAPVIQFLEQALEWGNLTYVPYPYYWARGIEWDDLTQIEGADPTYVDFLRAGSARVVVPARPGFELAVLHWLLYQEPFLGDPLPLPDDDLYVSVATEIRDLTGPPGGGEPGDCWEARLPTTLMWLEDEAQLPQNETRRLGKPPHAPKDPYCPAATPNGGGKPPNA